MTGRKIKITVRDGREGRDTSRVDEDGYGEILAVFESEHPIDEGEILQLPDGTKVVVIGSRERISPSEWSMDLAVGSLP